MKVIPLAYFASYLLSLLGNSIAAIALPIVVLQVTGSALGAGTVSIATAAPAVLVGLFAGVLIDRFNRRTASIVSDVISAAAMAALPIVDLITGLSLGWFVILGIVGAFGDVPGMTARQALLPAIVRYSGMKAERLMGLRESLGAFSLLVGPAAAGGLIALLGYIPVLWISAGASLLAALITLLVPHRVGTAVDDAGAAIVSSGTGWTQLREGWRVLFRSPFLVASVSITVATGVLLAGLQSMVLPVYFTAVGQPGMLGLVLSAMAGGMLVGGAVYAGAGGRGRRRVWLVTGMLGAAAGFVLIATLGSVWIVLAGAFLVGLSNGLFSGLLGVLLIERIPEATRGRVLGTQNAILMAAPPLGIGLAALLTEYIGVGVAAAALAAVWLVPLGIAVLARSMRDLEPAAPRREPVDAQQ